MSPAKKNSRTARAVRRSLLAERMATGPFSRYQLAELLGVHHDDLPTAAPLNLSVRALINLARHVDLHPADIVPELDPVLALRRHEPDLSAHDQEQPGPAEPDPAALLSALALARSPLGPGALCNALGWTLEQVHEALAVIEGDPDLSSPFALRRTPAGGYTLSPRVDLLTREQRARVDAAPDLDAFSFTAAHTALLLAAVAGGRSRRYGDWRHKYSHEHNDLVAVGVLIPVPGTIDRVDAHPDALYSLHGPDT